MISHPTPSRRVALLSTHDYDSPRRAGFHWLADAFFRAGYAVDFVTVGLSPISWLRSDYRLRRARARGFNHAFEIGPRKRGFYWLHPFHVINLRSGWANRISTPFFRLFARLPLGNLVPVIASADYVIVESSLALAFVPRVRQINPKARLIYRVSDDVTVVGNHPVLAEFEQAAVPHFDLISIPSDYMRCKFDASAPVAVHYHGIQKDLLDAQHDDPYERNGRPRVLTMGTTLFDQAAFLSFADECPDVDFHFFGSKDDLPWRSNVINHGERPFQDLVAYIQHCDVGLAPYLHVAGAEYLAQTSNKLMQFTYCQKPTLVPSFIPNRSPHLVPYDVTNSKNYSECIRTALGIDRTKINNREVCTWDEVREYLEH